MTQQHRVTWGDFDLDMDAPDPEYGFRVETMADGTNMGNPVRLVEVVKSLLTDGSLVERLGFDNREIPIRLRISAPAASAGPALSAAERLLSIQSQGDEFPPLSYTPPADGAAVCVFDVLDVKLERDLSDGWDFDELQREYRYYVLTFSTHPFPRDADPVTVPALPLPTDPGGVVEWTDVDTCGSTTGWTRETNAHAPVGPLAVSYGGETAVRVTANVDSPSDYLRLVRTGSIAVPADYYLALDIWVDLSEAGTGSWRAYYNGAWHTPTAQGAGLGEVGTTRLFFSDVGTITSFKVEYDFTSIPVPSQVTLDILNIAYTDTIGDTATSTSRQESRLAQVGGSAPTQAAIQFVRRSGGLGLGDVLIYTSSDSTWNPPLRRLIDTSAIVTANTSLVSGGYHSLTTSPTTILIPAAQIPDGMYNLLARLNVVATATLTWTAKMVDSTGADVSPLSDLVITETVDLAATGGDYTILALNSRSLALPVRRIGADQMVELTLSATGGSVLMDEGWLFSRTHGALTWIRDLGDLDWVEIQPVRLGEDALRHDAGTTATIVDDEVTALNGRFAVDDLCESVALHEWPPGERYIFTVQTNTLIASAWISYYRRFHSHVEAQA